ncbi:hypothetical protein ADT26_09350 [Xanthomonas oryzae]|nr:hypothetical protein ACU16_00645 [Xanthomonas oryzae pv. oryzicola]AKO06846.1 hypothetical protein ACU17_00655 [Xanthomonas oryzae pv. oryzicola]ALS96050.1 hypothetical protein AXO1947_17650 [Xanthomonas oryzae pv. oryzae]KOR44519.1 hypothetical protein ADT26_09350 [Xanthomonas oryzae]
MLARVFFTFIPLTIFTCSTTRDAFRLLPMIPGTKTIGTIRLDGMYSLTGSVSLLEVRFQA